MIHLYADKLHQFFRVWNAALSSNTARKDEVFNKYFAGSESGRGALGLGTAQVHDGGVVKATIRANPKLYTLATAKAVNFG